MILDMIREISTVIFEDFLVIFEIKEILTAILKCLYSKYIS